MNKLIIYDLDGTLIDSCQDIANAVNWTLKELGIRQLPLKQISTLVGRGVTHLMKNVLTEALNVRKPVGDALLKRSIELYRTHYSKHLLY